MFIARRLYIGKIFICLFASAVSIAFRTIIINPWDKACTMRVRQLIDEHICHGYRTNRLLIVSH